MISIKLKKRGITFYILCLIVFPTFFVLLQKYSNFLFDETTLYYYFSTIAQTIGALLGVLGAFSIFKIQKMEQDILEKLRNFYIRMETDRGAISDGAEVVKELFNSIREDYKYKNVKAIVKKCDKAFKKTKDNEFQGLKEEFYDMGGRYYIKCSIILILSIVTVLSLILILFSISMLLCTKMIIQHDFFLGYILVGSWLLLFSILYFFYKLIHILLK